MLTDATTITIGNITIRTRTSISTVSIYTFAITWANIFNIALVDICKENLKITELETISVVQTNESEYNKV